MNAASSTCSQAISSATRNVTSSQASAGGRSARASQDGPTIANSGQARARASRSASSATKKGKKTKGTCGRNTSDSSPPDGPLLSWENRLRQRLASLGSTECLLTWRQSVTPHGHSYSQLAPSTAPHRRDRIWFLGDGYGAVGDSECEGLERHAGDVDAARGRAHAHRPVAAADGRSGSAWAGAEWITGHDGKVRRVKPGVRLLDHGIPARVGRLSAYGNAIVPQVAAEVIGAYMDCVP